MLFAGVIGARISMLLADRTAHDVEQLEVGLETFAEGDLSHRILPAGPRELRDLAVSANVMAGELERMRNERDDADRARRNLIASVSHDLRTPLTSLRLLVEAIDDGVVEGPDETADALRRAKQHVTTLSTLVDDLFELARLEAGDISWTLSQVGVAELIDETVEAFRPQAEQKGLVLAEDVARDVSAVRGNPEKLQRVLYNLVQNAVRHTPQDGTVTLRAEPADGFVRIEVADDGEGIPPEQAEQVFDRFFRGGDGARNGAGAGLGLSISRAIVEAHGGRIWIEPGNGRGSRVIFTVPAAT
jgi:signal transduction histidine kinase